MNKEQMRMPSDEAIKQAMKDLSMGIIATVRDNIMKMIQDGLIYPPGLVEAMQERIEELELEIKILKEQKR